MCLGCVLSVAPVFAQDREDPSSAPRGDASSPRAPTTPPPAPDKPAPTREFRPSEEVSPDQEVDFPADL